MKLQNVEMINLTPHVINFLDGREVKSSGILRVDTEVVIVGDIDWIAVTTTEFKDSVSLTVNGEESKELPPVKEGVIYIVSLPCAQYIEQYHPERTDFFIPGEVARDGEGKIVGCKSLAVHKNS